jgi:hypothetical protein
MAFDEKEYQTDTIEHVSNDSSHDEIAAEAKGGDLSEMPAGYYKSWRFIGSVVAVVFMAQGLYLGTCTSWVALNAQLTSTPRLCSPSKHHHHHQRRPRSGS